SLCTCCRHYPGAATGRLISLGNPAVSAFPERVVGSACASSFSRLARRSLALRPAHSRCHQFVTRIPTASARSLPPWMLWLLPAGGIAGAALHALESAALSRRTPVADSPERQLNALRKAHGVRSPRCCGVMDSPNRKLWNVGAAMP